MLHKVARKRYRSVFGREPDPGSETFTGKIYRRKVSDRNPLYPEFADKVKVKQRVEKLLGPGWVIPTLWSGDDLDELDLTALPLPFVVKANHGSGWNVFVRSEAELDPPAIRRQCARWLGRKYGEEYGEWLYRSIKPQILVEPFINDLASLPHDYKIFVFGGKAHYVQVDTDREWADKHGRTFYDRDWAKQPFALGREKPVSWDIPRPQSLEAMLAAAEKLASPFSFARVDFYEIKGRPLFGEVTFYPGSGLSHFDPESWDLVFGRLWP